MKKSKRYRQHQNYLRKWKKVGTYTSNQCKICNSLLLFVFSHDALCCPNCNEWIDQKCEDPDCVFCSTRPDTPAESLISEKPMINKHYYLKQYEKRWRGFMHKKKCQDRYRQ